MNSSIDVARILIGGGRRAQSANTMQYDVTINFQNKGLFWDKNTLEGKVWNLGFRFVRKQDVAEGRGLEPKICVKFWRCGEETNVTQVGSGEGHPAAGGYEKLFENFCNFLEKIAILMPLNHILHVLEQFEKTKFKRI